MDVMDNIAEDLPCPCMHLVIVSSKTWDLWCRRLDHPHPDHRSCLMLKFIFSIKQNLFSINIHELSKLCFLESFTIYTASFDSVHSDV